MLGGPGLTAEAGAAFADAPRVKAVLSDGKPAVGQEVVFAVESDTTGGTGFPQAPANSLVVKTDAQGIAAAPGLKAGAKEGTFSLRVSAYDKTGRLTVTFTGKVTPKPSADRLARPEGSKPLEAVAGSSVKGVEVFATAAWQGRGGYGDPRRPGGEGRGRQVGPGGPGDREGPVLQGRGRRRRPSACRSSWRAPTARSSCRSSSPTPTSPRGRTPCG